MQHGSVRISRRWALGVAMCAAMALGSGAASAASIAFTGTQMNVDAPTGPAAPRCGAAVTVNIGNGPDSTSTGMSNLGSFTSTQSHCILPPPPVSYDQGLFEYMFGAGDTLLGTYTGDLTFDSPGLFDNRQNFVVTGGTGRFAGATGSFLGVGTVDFRGATPSAQLEFSGALDAPAIPEPATWALMIIGFGGVGCGIRRRSSRSATAAA